MSIETTLADLDALLDEERAALLDGQIGQVGDLARKKQDLLDQLRNSDTPLDRHILPLREKIAHNHGLIESALDGIHSVAQRLEEMRRIRNVLHTYDRTGARHEVRMQSGREVETRA